MRISDLIAEFILDTLAESGTAELQRSELADRFNCVPSQINYVLSTRFSPEQGYTVESRRGGGGYIRISRFRADGPALIMHTVNAVGDTLDQQSAMVILRNLVQNGAVEERAAQVLMTAISDNALATLPPEIRGQLRARIFKLVLVTL